MGLQARKVFCAWLVLDGVIWDIIIGGMLPAVAAKQLEMVASENTIVDPVTVRHVGYGMLLHGTLRAAAGFNLDNSTLARLAATSYMIENWMWVSEWLNGTVREWFIPFALTVNSLWCVILLHYISRNRDNVKGCHAN